MRKTLLWLLVLAVSISMVATFSLAGCKEEAAPAEEVEEEEAVPEEVTIVVWDQFSDPWEDEAMVVLVDNFTEKYPYITIERTATPMEEMQKIIFTEFAAGTGPDISYYDTVPSQLGELVSAGYVYPLDDAYKEFGWDTKLFKWVQDLVTYGDHIYGVPTIGGIEGLFYNERILEELGLDVPTSMEEFETACEAAKAAGYIPIAHGIKDRWNIVNFLCGHLLQISGASKEYLNGLDNYMNDTSKWTDPDIVWALDLYQSWAEKDWLMPEPLAVGYDDENMDFTAGKALFDIDGNWMAGSHSESAVDEGMIHFIPLPMRDPGQPIMVQVYVNSAWFVSVKTAEDEGKLDAAVKFIDYVGTSDDAAREFFKSAGFVSVYDADLSGLEMLPMVQETIDAQEMVGDNAVTLLPGFALSSETYDLIMTLGQKLIDGEISAEDMADQLQEAWDAKKAELREE